MIRKISILSIFVACFMIFMTSHMYAKGEARSTAQPVPGVSAPIPETITADAWGIFDPKTGDVVVGDNIQTTHQIASVTKLFTAAVVMVSEKKDEEFEIILSDVYTEGRAGKLIAGTKTTSYGLLFPLLLESSNDAGTAISRHLGTTFQASINGIIQTLSLSKTNISEATGLSSKNVSTVSDLAVFYAYLKSTHPHILDITELYTYIDERTGYGNSNPARTLSSFTGGKQGYTDEAGRTFVGTFTLPGTSTELGIVLLKSTDLLSDIEDIIAYAKSRQTTSDILLP